MYTVYACLAMLAVRLLGVYVVDVDWQDLHYADLSNLLFMGLRFDLAFILRAALLLLLINAAGLLMPRFISHWLLKFSTVALWCFIFIFVYLSIGNLAYLSFFGNAYDEFAIEGLLFDWRMVLASTFEAGNSLVFAMLGGLVSLLVVVLAMLSNRAAIGHNLANKNLLLKLLLVGLSVVMVFVLARGSVSSYPLVRKFSAVTSSAELNKLVENGPFALYEAYRGFSNSESLLPATADEGRHLFQQFFGVPAEDGTAVFEQFFSSTAINSSLEQAPPHVVLAIAESFSSSLLDESITQSTELAQGLTSHFTEGVYFPRFFPAHNDTTSSVINMMTNLDFPTVSQSKYRMVSLPTAAMDVYKQHGYDTIYIYAGYETERNIQEYLLQQGFDEFIGAYGLQRRYPDMALTVQGAEDYYAVAYAEELLSKATKPTVIVVQTITNHPPYEAPNIPSNPLSLDVTPKLVELNGSLPEEALRTYQYTAEVIGGFLTRLKSSKLSDQVVFAVTGDHGARGLATDATTFLQTKAVPFYLYVPKNLLNNTNLNDIDSYQVASHRDIMPTLYHLTLSGARYMNTGRNLLAGQLDKQDFAIANGHIVTNQGLYQAEINTYRPFEKPTSMLLRGTSEAPTTSSTSAKTYARVLDWLKRYQLQSQDLVAK